MADLLSVADLPPGFVYPAAFVRIVELGLTALEPWWILQGQELITRTKGLQDRYPGRTLDPFARRQDNDDVACWDLDSGVESISVVHDFASPGWEQQEMYVEFADWFRAAMEDLLEFE